MKEKGAEWKECSPEEKCQEIPEDPYLHPEGRQHLHLQVVREVFRHGSHRQHRELVRHGSKGFPSGGPSDQVLSRSKRSTWSRLAEEPFSPPETTVERSDRVIPRAGPRIILVVGKPQMVVLQGDPGVCEA